MTQKIIMKLHLCSLYLKAQNILREYDEDMFLAQMYDVFKKSKLAI